MKTLQLGGLGLDRGGTILLKHSLRQVPEGEGLEVRGESTDLEVHLRAWCRTQGHRLEPMQETGKACVVRGFADRGRWGGAERAGLPERVVDDAPPHWGLAPRGALVEAGAPSFDFPLHLRREIWAEEAARLYRQAAAAQWDPATAIPWDAEFSLPQEVEEAVVQVMTYLVENETAALIIPARFAARVHPHFREVMQLLAIQAADEARHLEVFTRRAWLKWSRPGLTTVGGQTSLKTLIDEPDFVLASFLLSVLGEGSFLSLLWFLHGNAPDVVTREISRLAAQDEARHVAFGMAHLARHVQEDPALRGTLAQAVERRHAALEHTAGLNEEVFEALVVLAAGAWEADAVAQGWEKVQTLVRDMDAGRRQRLQKLGFDAASAAALSALHTRNFM